MNIFKSLNQRGIFHIALLLAAVGLIGFIVVSSSGEFKNKLFSSLFPKSKSFAEEKAKEDISRLTKQLISAQDNLAATFPGLSSPFIVGQSQAIRVSIMRNIALERKKLIIQQLDDNPLLIFDNRISQSIRDSMPDQVKVNVETEIKKEGKINVIHGDDIVNKKSSYQYYLKETKGFSRVYFTKRPRQLVSGVDVAISGVAIDDKVIADIRTNGNLKINTVSSSSSGSHDKNIEYLVLLANFQDSTNNPYSVEELNQVLSDGSESVKQYYAVASESNLSLSFKVVGPYTLPYSNTEGCFSTKFLFDALEMAHDKGIDMSTYTHFMVITPVVPDCYYSGATFIGAIRNTEYTYIKDYIYPIHINGKYEDPSVGKGIVIEHEIGHNLGMHHANFLLCGSKSIDLFTNCDDREYGDNSDIMGDWQAGFNAPHKIQLGWVPSSQIQTVTSSTTQRLVPLTSANGTKVIIIPNLSEAIFGDKRPLNYYLSYRQKTGVDASLFDALTEGASIHMAQSTENGIDFYGLRLYDFTYILNAIPGGKIGSEAVFKDGAVFKDTINGIQIKQISHNSSEVALEISFTGVTIIPSPKPPTYTLSGYIFIDNNDNNIFDEGEEKYKEGTEVLLRQYKIPPSPVADVEGVFNPTLSDDRGDYDFTKVPAGEYWLDITIPIGYKITRNNSRPVHSPSLTTDAFNFAIVPALSLSCASEVDGFTITWTALIDKAVADKVTYYWSSPDGLSGDTKTATKTYDTLGLKSAKVTVTYTDGSIDTALCEASIKEAPPVKNLNR